MVCCSNGVPQSCRSELNELESAIVRSGLVPIWSDYIYQKDSIFSGSASQRADSLMSFYRNPQIKVIFDVSGGDIANEILPLLDFEQIAASGKYFWGYSDLTVIVNGIYAKTGRESVLYSVRNLAKSHGHEQTERFKASVLEGKEDLFSFSWDFIQKRQMKGIVAGGNIRCFLKLAGTEYWPSMEGKILLLEALGGTIPQMVTYLNQLKQLGVFEQISGILLGTFTQMEKESCRPAMADLVKEYAGRELPIACTGEIGHGSDAKAVVIGREYCFAEKP